MRSIILTSPDEYFLRYAPNSTIANEIIQVRLFDNHQRTVSAYIPVTAVVDGDIVSRGYPTEEPFGIFVVQVNATVTHLQAKIAVPKSAVEGHAAFEDEKTRPRYAGENILIRRAGSLHAAHMFGGGFGGDMEFTARRLESAWNGCAARAG